MSQQEERNEMSTGCGRLYHDNIICLPREPEGRLRQPPRKEAGAMVTYSDLFSLVIMLCAVITLVIYATRKK